MVKNIRKTAKYCDLRDRIATDIREALGPVQEELDLGDAIPGTSGTRSSHVSPPPPDDVEEIPRATLRATVETAASPPPPPDSPDLSSPGSDGPGDLDENRHDPVREYLNFLLASDRTLEADREILAPLLADPTPATEVLESSFSVLRGDTPRQPRRHHGAARDSQGVGGESSGRARRSAYYGKVQALFSSERAYLAGRLLDGMRLDDLMTTPTHEDITTEYDAIFGTVPDLDDLAITDARPLDEYLYAPVHVEEIRKALLEKASDAAGPDGMKMVDLSVSPLTAWVYFSMQCCTRVRRH